VTQPQKMRGQAAERLTSGRGVALTAVRWGQNSSLERPRRPLSVAKNSFPAGGHITHITFPRANRRRRGVAPDRQGGIDS
jgi:hypothetical protein